MSDNCDDVFRAMLTCLNPAPTEADVVAHREYMLGKIRGDAQAMSVLSDGAGGIDRAKLIECLHLGALSLS